MSLSVWILEPCPRDADLLKKIWRTAGGPRIRIRCFATAEALLSRARKEGLPDLITGDLFHEASSGTKLILTLRRYGPVDVIPVTADRHPSAFTRAFLLGICDYLLKPCPASRLTLCARRYLRLKSAISPVRPLSQRIIDRYFFPPDPFRDGKPSAPPASSLTGARRDRLHQEILLLRDHPEGLLLCDLCRALSLSETAVRSDLSVLLEGSMVVARPVLNHRPGRPLTRYYLPE